MLKRITIKNFRSLKDVTIDLQDVNLFIGPNNSGKTNFLKALEFVEKFYNNTLEEDITKYTFQNKITERNQPIFFLFEFLVSERQSFYIIIELYDRNVYVEFHGTGIPNFQLKHTVKLGENLFNYFTIEYLAATNITPVWKDYALNLKGFDMIDSGKNILLTSKTSLDFFNIFKKEYLTKFMIYAPDISKIRLPNLITLPTYKLEKDASNLASFLDDLQGRYRTMYKEIQNDLNICISEFDNIISKKVKVPQDKIGLLLGIEDKFGIEYWADELSDGVLYFLALLSIIHQPDPPKLLLLEEPEKGIHPRRISEIIDFIFQLAETKGIQIILTTHSTQVVDEFKDLTEGVFIFEKEGAETKIKNLERDIIEPTNKDLKKKKLSPISYSDGLGEHWAMGFIGGVPK